MARSFAAHDAKRKINELENILIDLNETSDELSILENDIKQSVDEILVRESIQLLKDVSVDELNRDKRGIRVKALKDSGYETIADLAGVSPYQLASINGISHDAAYTIKHIAGQITKRTTSAVKIRLSSDNKSPRMTSLVRAIDIYKRSVPFINRAQELYEDNKQSTEYLIEDLTPGTKTIGWIFVSSAKKIRVEEAYKRATDIYENGYINEAQKILSELNKIKRISDDNVWEDFEKEPIRFVNILERIAPESVGGNDNGEYGLPEDLAREIQDQGFFPDGLKCELRPYQEWGVKYILHQEKVILGDEMGLGKTVQAIASMVSLRNTGATHFVVVCPASVISNWCREIRKHSMLSVTKVHGQGRKAALESWKRTGGVAVTTYETTGYFNLEDDFKFSLLTVDEAHYIKNPEARRSVNVKSISEHAERLLFMTGTALENKVDEMVVLMQILQPRVAASVRGMTHLASAPEFRERVAPVYYRRKREDVLKELPELIEKQQWCQMGAEETRRYEEAVLSKNYQASRRVSWNVDDLANSSKAQRLLEIVEESEAEGRKVIVFSFFLDTISKIHDLLGEKCTNPINGSVTPIRRQEIIDDFDKAPAGTVLLAQIQSGGTGLNIQSASVVVICEPQFKPSIENQAISRAYRMGQTRNVLVHRLLCEESIDEKLTELLASKQQIFDAFADKSVAAEVAGESEVSEKKFGELIKEEIDRINNKNGNRNSEN